MAEQQNNPFSLLMILGLLAFGPTNTVNKGLESLSYTLDATAKSLESVKTGMDTLNTGLQQFTNLNKGSAGFGHSDSGETVNKQQGRWPSIMPADAPNGENEESYGNNDMKEDTNSSMPVDNSEDIS